VARQPLISSPWRLGARPSSGAAVVAASILAASILIGCREVLPYEGAFDLPIAATVLQPEVGGPFEEPVGFVANGHGGQIVPLALKQGRFLTDDPTVSFLRTNPLPTGASRRLTGVAVVAKGLREVTVWAADSAFDTLVRVPYLYDCETTPERPECEGAPAGAPVEQAAYWQPVSSPEGASLANVQVKRGYTTTELWTITFDGTDWSVEGSRSGREPERALTGQWYTTDLHRLSFTIRGTASPGDQFVVRTQSGLTEHDVGGTPTALVASPDHQLLAVVVQDQVLDRPFVRWFDLEEREVVGEVTLAEDAQPHRLSWSEDGVLLIADAGHPAVWEVEAGGTVALEHPTPWPTLDVTALDGEDRRRLYVVPLDSGSLWLMDRDTDELLDVNAALPGIQGLPFTASVMGIEAIPRPYLMPEYTDDAIRRTDRSVALVMSNNRIVYAHEETGCLVQDNLGPRTEPTQSSLSAGYDYAWSWSNNEVGAPFLEDQGASGRHVSVNACAGIAPTEQWRLTFDEILQAWEVRGSVSGVQEALVIEDVRYLSDGGEISFVLRSGVTPTRDGWAITFDVNAGSAQATGDLDNPPDGIPEIALGVASDPSYYEYRVGLAGPIGDHEGAGWYPVDVRPLLLVLGSSTNQVARVDPQEEPPGAGVELEWQ
jgi:hypothetical protein